MTKFEKIKQLIVEYQKTADRHYADYQAKEKRAREKYSEAGFQSEFIQKVWPEMAGKIWAECDDTIRKVEEVFDEIEQNFKKWMMEPLDESMIQVLNCIDSFGLFPSLKELKIIESAVRESYWGTRIFTGLAQKSGYQVNVPTVDSYQKALETARSNAKLAIRAYAGAPSEGYPGRDLLQKWESRGIVMGEYEPYHLFFAANYLHENGELDRLEQIWGTARAPMRYSLTTAEAEKVKKSIEGVMKDGELNKEDTKKLIEEQPDIKDRLESMPNNYFDDKKELVNYFGLNQKVEKEESLISPAVQNAKEYGTRFQKVDAETLKRFE